MIFTVKLIKIAFLLILKKIFMYKNYTQQPTADKINSIEMLLTKAQAIAGLSLAEIGEKFNRKIPPSLKQNKGFVGQLIELALGADAKSQAMCDFSAIGVELKTIPIDLNYKVLESTFVCLAPLTKNSGIHWHNSHLYQKLKHVLWVPILSNGNVLAQRIVGAPILWQPTQAQEALLRSDWEELMEMIILGKHQQINAYLGEVLQLRPKGANNKERTNAIDFDGNKTTALPLGFYLRPKFTQNILNDFMDGKIKTN